MIAWTFTVDGAATDLADLNVQPVTLQHTFGQGAILTLRQTQDHHDRALTPGSVVVALAGGTARFKGTVKSMSRSAMGDGTSGITYEVMDDLASAFGVHIELDDISEATVGEAVRRAAEAAGYTVAADVDSMTEPADLGMAVYAGSLKEFIDLAMRRMPKYRLTVDGLGTWHARQVIDAAATASLQWGGTATQESDLSGRIASVQLQDRVDGCYTAVELVRPVDPAATKVAHYYETLVPAWDSELESDWSLRDTGHADPDDEGMDPDTPQSERAMVYRAWENTTSLSQFDPNRPWKFMVLVPTLPQSDFGLEKWVSIQADYVEIGDRKLFITKHPVTIKGSVRMRGKARPPSQVKLRYQVNIKPRTYKRVRVPETGYEGSAYDTYGVERLKRLETYSLNQTTTERAQAILDALKSIVHDGSIKVYDAMPSWAWSGGRMIQIVGKTSAGASIAVDYQSMRLAQTGYAINFGDNTHDIMVTDDRSFLADYL